MRLGINETSATDSTKPLTYTIRGEDGQLAKITYLPQGKGRVTRQKLELPTDLSPARRAACAGDAAG